MEERQPPDGAEGHTTHSETVATEDSTTPAMASGSIQNSTSEEFYRRQPLEPQNEEDDGITELKRLASKCKNCVINKKLSGT